VSSAAVLSESWFGIGSTATLATYQALAEPISTVRDLRAECRWRDFCRSDRAPVPRRDDLQCDRGPARRRDALFGEANQELPVCFKF
jgi:hypothetical protein